MTPQSRLACGLMPVALAFIGLACATATPASTFEPAPAIVVVVEDAAGLPSFDPDAYATACVADGDCAIVTAITHCSSGLCSAPVAVRADPAEPEFSSTFTACIGHGQQSFDSCRPRAGCIDARCTVTWNGRGDDPADAAREATAPDASN